MTTPTIKSIKEVLGDRYTPEIEAAWPDVLPPIFPCGQRLLVQLRTFTRNLKFKGGGGLILPDEKRDMDKARGQTGLIRAMGPVAFRNRTTLTLWPEGEWAVEGTFVRTPMYGGDRFEVPIPGREAGDTALFVTFQDLDVMGLVLGDPLDVVVG